MPSKVSIIRIISYYQRLISTAVAYAVFGLGGILIYLCYPILQIAPLSTEKKQYYGRRIIHYCFRFFVFFMKTMNIFTYEISNAEKLKKPGQLIVANHPTLIDVTFLLACIPESNCIVRHGLMNNIFTRGPLKTARYIANKNPEQLISDCTQTLINNNSLLIFPEGTRTKATKNMHLKKGTANIALRSKKSLRPVIITCNPPMLQKGIKWYNIPKTRPHFVIQVKDTFPIQPYLNDEHSISVKSRLLTKDLLCFFEQEITKQSTAH